MLSHAEHFTDFNMVNIFNSTDIIVIIAVKVMPQIMRFCSAKYELISGKFVWNKVSIISEDNRCLSLTIK